MEKPLAHCGLCGFGKDGLCKTASGHGPEGCPTACYPDLAAETFTRCRDEVGEFWKQSALEEASGYACRELGDDMRRGQKPRIVELVEFARRMGYHRLGLIFCIGLKKEANVVHRIFETNGFEVVSVICKAGRVLKSSLGISREDQCNIFTDEESICNPAFQAAVVNMQETEFNVLLGLCVGHDTIAMKYAKAPCTVLAVKDRVTGHNPLAPIYQYDSYYKYLKKPLP